VAGLEKKLAALYNTLKLCSGFHSRLPDLAKCQKVPIWLFLAAIGTLKFGYGTLLHF